MRSHNKAPYVAVIYPFIPHYRKAVFTQLSESNTFSYSFFYSDNIKSKDISVEEAVPRSEKLPIVFLGPLSYQFGLFRKILFDPYSAYIFHPVPHSLSMWVYPIVARLRGRVVLFWTHGWLGNEKGLRRFLRQLLHGLAHGLLLYGERARKIGIARGHNPKTLHVIYNSLEYERQKEIRTNLERKFNHSTLDPYFLCIARLTKKMRLDIAIIALRLIRERTGRRVQLVLIGDGEERENLKRIAREQDVDVKLLGPLYDEEVIGPWIYGARAIVSPGKVGLTAMHGLAYGVPVVTHDDYDNQMPEFEAIVNRMLRGTFLGREVPTHSRLCSPNGSTDLERRQSAKPPSIGSTHFISDETSCGDRAGAQRILSSRAPWKSVRVL